MMATETKVKKKYFNMDMYHNTNVDSRILSCMSNKEFFLSLYTKYGCPTNSTDKMLQRRAAVTTVLVELSMHDITFTINGPIYAIGCDFLSYVDKHGGIIET